MDKKKSLLLKMAEVMDDHFQERKSRDAETLPRVYSRSQRLLRWFLPNGGTILVVLVLIFTQSAWARSLNSPMNVPGPSATTINYQGRLADIAGVPLDGSYDLSFAIYGSADGTDLIWPTTGPELHVNVPVSTGLFSVGLGSLTAGGIPTTVWNGDRYLEIGVEGETLSPRELIRGVPVAGMALTVPDGAIDSAQIADNSIITSKIANSAITLDKLDPSSRVSASKAVNGNAVSVGTTATTLSELTITLSTQSSVLVMPYARAISPGHYRMYIYRDGALIASEIEFSTYNEHSSMSYTFLDTNVPGGSHTYNFTAKLIGGSQGWVHQPGINSIVIP